MCLQYTFYVIYSELDFNYKSDHCYRGGRSEAVCMGLNGHVFIVPRRNALLNDKLQRCDYNVFIKT